MNRLLIGGLLTLVLIFLYLYSLVTALLFASGCTQDTCPLDANVAFLLQTLGGLVSAVVVSELSVTSPGEAPGARISDVAVSNVQQRASTFVASAYILVWIVSGVALIILGWIQHSHVPEVVSAGKEWLGFAMAAGYAYFGVSAPTKPANVNVP